MKVKIVGLVSGFACAEEFSLTICVTGTAQDGGSVRNTFKELSEVLLREGTRKQGRKP